MVSSYKSVTDSRMVIDVVAPGYGSDDITVKAAKTSDGNGKKVFSWKSILSFVVPTLLLGAVFVWQQEAIIKPQEQRIKHIEAAVAKTDPARIERLKTHDAFVKKQNGEALTKDVPLLEWSDMTTSRMPSRTVRTEVGDQFISLTIWGGMGRNESLSLSRMPCTILGL